MLCKNCGKEIADTAKFCGYCGAQVEAIPVTPAEVPAEQPQESVTNIFGVETPAVTEETTVMAPVKEPASQQPDLSWIADTAPAAPATPVAPAEPVPTPAVELPSFDMATPEPAVAPAPAEVPVAPVPTEPVVETPTLEVPVAPVVETPVVAPLPEVKPLEEVKIDTLPVPPKEPEAVKEPEVKVNNKKDFSTFLILFLTVVVVLLGVFIVWDKFLNVEPPKEVDVEAGKLTEADALKIAQEKYDALYGDTFVTIYTNAVAGDVEEAGKYFTNDAVSRMGVSYTIGLFGVVNQTKRTLSVELFDENKIIVKGKNDTDKQYYYMTLIKVGEDWLIDMFE